MAEGKERVETGWESEAAGCEEKEGARGKTRFLRVKRGMRQEEKSGHGMMRKRMMQGKDEVAEG